MRTLDRYLLREMFLPFLCGIFAVIVMLVGNTLYALVNIILQNHIPLLIIARLVVFNIPSLIVLTLPVGVALSAALAVNRLARDSEVTVIRMAGVPLLRIFAPIFALGFLASGFSFWMNEYVVPRAQVEFQKTQSAMFGYALQSSPDLVSNRVFTYQNYSFFVHEATQGVPGHPKALQASGVFIYEAPQGLDIFPRLITAKSAVYENGVWQLSNLIVHSFDSDGFTSAEMSASSSTLDLRTPIPIDNSPNSGLAGQPDQYTMEELSQQLKVLQRTGQDTTAVNVAYNFKVALPFLCLAFALCAPPLSLKFAGTGSFFGVFLSIVMVFVAWNTLLLTKALGLSGDLPPFLAAWAPDLIFAALGIYLLRRSE